MNRRQFLTRLFGAAAVAALPPLPRLLTNCTIEDWVRAIVVVQQDFICDRVMFGIGMLESCDEFPFIRTVDPAKLHLASKGLPYYA